MDGHTRLRAAERYSLALRQWELIGDMNEKRSDASACACDVLGRVYCAGGFNGQECLFTAEFYCPLNKIWTQVRVFFGLSRFFSIFVLETIFFWNF